MKVSTALFITLATLFICSSCNTTKYTPSDYPDAQLVFGNGGGFTGLYTEYILFENGQLFTKKSNEENFSALPRAKANTVDQIFKNYSVLGLGEYSFSIPGNVTYYIEFKDSKGSHRITWGDLGNGIREDVKVYSKMLYQLVKEEK